MILIMLLSTEMMLRPAVLEEVFSFQGGPRGPLAPLVQGSDGAFYGTTRFGGNWDAGTVFRMTTNGSISTIASFGFPNGVNPNAGLVQGDDGEFFGTTLQ